ncbi:MAG TPA: glycosyltransferase family 4 protein [Mycobacteriales bacterium]|nr:glycosyltransferase family 4 protein [Mycobacteriales bacterium]
MRVLMLSWEYPPIMVGGLGRHAHALAEALAATGHEVTVVSRHGEGAPYDEVVNGVRVVRVPEDPPVFPFDTQLLAWAMAFNHAMSRAALRVVEQARPDVIHAHDWLVAHAATTAKHHTSAALVATIHATEAGRHQGWLPGPTSRAIHSVEWWLTYEARRVVTCSSYMRWEVTRLFDLPPDKVDVVPNGVSLDRWRGNPERATETRSRFPALAGSTGPLVVYAGRLVYEKGVHDLLRAMPRLRRRHPGIRLVLAGEGPHDAALRDQARALRLGRSVTFTGFLAEPDLAALAAAADCAVVPSIYEPFGMVALEAAAAGTPLVVTDVGGLREFVQHGVTGLRFSPGDVAGLADAVSSVLRDEVLARRLTRQARVVLERDYAWPRVAGQVAGTYLRARREERALRDSLDRRPPLSMEPRDGNLLTGEPS